MVKYSKAVHAANAEKTRTLNNFNKQLQTDEGPEPLQIYVLK
jgi:hypothetical protein